MSKHDHDDDLIAQDEAARARAIMNRTSWRPSPEAQAARERKRLREIDAAVASARTFAERSKSGATRTPAAASPVSPRLAEVRRELASLRPELPAAALEQEAQTVARVLDKRDARDRLAPRAESEPAPASPYDTIACFKCGKGIAPSDPAYCGPCAGQDEQRMDGNSTRNCTACSEPTGARTYCAGCAGKGQKQAAAAVVTRPVRAKTSARNADQARVPAGLRGEQPGFVHSPTCALSSSCYCWANASIKVLRDVTAKNRPLSSEERAKVNAFWRAGADAWKRPSARSDSADDYYAEISIK